MPDVGIGIGVTGGKDAKEFVDALTRSLRLLGQQGQAQAIESRRAADAARDYAKALQDQSAAAKQNLLAEQDRLRALQESGSKVNRLTKQILDNQIAAHTRRIAMLEEEARKAEEVARRTAAAASRRVGGAVSGLDSARQASDAVVKAAEKQAAGVIAAKTKETNAFVQTTQSGIRNAEQYVRTLEFQAKQEAAIDKRRLNEARNFLKEQLRLSDPAKRTPEQKATIAGARQSLSLTQDNVRDRAAARSEALNTIRRGLQLTKDAADQEIAQRQRVLQAVIAQENAKLAAVKTTAAATIKAAQDQLDKTKAFAGQATAATKAQATAAQQALTQAQKTGAANIATQRQTGQAQVAAARRVIAAQQQVATGARQQATAQAQAATIAQRAANVAQRAATTTAAAFKNQAAQAASLTASMSRLRNTVLQLASAYVGFRSLFGAIKAGLEFNQIIESSTLGIAALITAEAKLEDQHGNLLTGTNALKSAQVLAKDQLDKLRIAGIQTAATTEDLVRAFQEAVGAGVSVGLTLDQIRVFTVQIAQAAGAINLPFNQLNQEVRSILQGTIDRNSRIAKALQLTNEQVRLAKEEGRLADLLNEKFKAFNIAGLEVVKTFSGLKSTVKDAFQVLSGRAVEPLFNQIRIAGLKALSSIFDFRSAEVQESFKGLIRGAQEIFGEIGRLFAQALGNAVSGAEALSLWLDRNRQEVKQTAAAISTMVKEFGNMVLAIGEAVLGFGKMAGGANAVVGITRILSDLFRAIAENAKLIVGLLTARALITTLGSIVGLITAITGRAAGVTIGAAIGTALGGPGIGTAIGGVVGLLIAAATASKLLSGHQSDVAREAASVTTALDDQKFTIAGLVGDYITLQRQLHAQGVSTEEQAALQKRLNDVIAKLRTAGGQQYLDIINKQTRSIEDQRKALLGLLRAEATLAAEREGDARNRARALEQQLRLAEAQAKPRTFSGGITLAPDKKAIENVQRLRDEWELAQAQVVGFTTQTDRMTEALNRAAEVPPKIKLDADPNAAAGGEPAFIKQMRARLERLKAQLDAERAEIDAAFSRGSITAVEHIIRLGEVDRAEIAAEGKFLEAQRREAERKVEVAEKSKGKNRDERIKVAIDALKAIDIQESIFESKRDKQRADESAAILEATRETAQSKEAIEIRFLEATGQHLEAARREIENKNTDTIREAIREFGTEIPEELRQRLLDANGPELGRLLTEFSKDLPPVLLRLRTALDHEALEAQAKEIKSEIENITSQRTAELANINARFGRSGKLSDSEKQEKDDLIAKANLRASLSANQLREDLDRMREAAAADPTLVTFIDGLIASLDTLREKSIEVDQEMEKLKDGLRDSVEEGIGGFLQGFIDKTFDVAEAFADMVRNIIGEMNKLVSQLLAKRITDALFKVFGVAAGAATGSSAAQALVDSDFGLTPPAQLRAAGGPAYGPLSGGIRGKDSIPVLAQADEWFLRPQVRRKYGDDFLWALNNLDLPKIDFRKWPKFALGGPVGPEHANGPARLTAEHLHRIGVDSDGMMRFLMGPVFGKVVRDHVKSAPRSIERVLGARLNGK